jgi:hypothetical protein
LMSRPKSLLKEKAAADAFKVLNEFK